MTADDVLTAERDHLQLAERCLTAMRESAEHIADYGVDELASHALGRIRSQRLAALAADPDAPPFFGRTDRDPEDGHEHGADPAAPETLHIGRRHVRDAAGDPIVIDWRAPISRGFYRATPEHRMGVRLRRRFGFQHGGLSSYEDERLDHGEQLGLGSDLLRAEIERPRVGPMRDIVATIQPDQDEYVRAGLDTSLCIQGAPGTGKTAVGLHRAAYLLYTYPERLRRTGVLVLGPNAAFLDYIAQVLPSLGEGGIAQSTVGELVPWEVRADEAPELAILKGDARWAPILDRAVLSHIVKPADDIVVVIETKRYRVGAHHLRRYVDDARRSLGTGLRWSAARDRLRMQVGEDVRRQREDRGGAPTDAETARVARSRAVKDWLDAVWPDLSAPALLARLYADPAFLRRCARDVFTDAELAALQRTSPKAVRSIRWTPADTALLAELDSLVNGNDTFVHIVVDEAQDLSAMQCRVVARRCPLGSLTVLGDLAQATTPWAPGSWPATLEHLGAPDTTIRPLTAGYRVPGEVLALANRLLPHIAPDVPPATSIRHGDGALSAGSDLPAAVRECVGVEGSIGVIVSDAAVPDVLDALARAGLDARPLGGDSGARVEVVPATQAKGLEFDSVVLVEPAVIVAAEPLRVDGLRRLYVTLTRAVSRLRIVHDQQLPPELAAPQTR